MGEMTLFIPLIIGLGLIMFLSSRRQKKAMQATIDLHDSLAIGDRVHTTSGLEATITRIDDDSVDLEIAPGVITTWMKLAVRDRVENDDDVDDEQDALDGETDDAVVPASDGTPPAPAASANTASSASANTASSASANPASSASANPASSGAPTTNPASSPKTDS